MPVPVWRDSSSMELPGPVLGGSCLLELSGGGYPPCLRFSVLAVVLPSITCRGPWPAVTPCLRAGRRVCIVWPLADAGAVWGYPVLLERI